MKKYLFLFCCLLFSNAFGQRQLLPLDERKLRRTLSHFLVPRLRGSKRSFDETALTRILLDGYRGEFDEVLFLGVEGLTKSIKLGYSLCQLIEKCAQR